MAALMPDLPKVEQHIVEMTNQVRRDQKLPTLKLNAMLSNAARAFARSLARSGQFSHTADGQSPAQRAERAGYKYCMIAENLAMDRNDQGFSTGELAIQAMAGWMNSAPHRANIMMPAATEIGVGIAQALDPAKFVSVELLGRPASASYKFQIVNASNTDVSYTFAGKGQALKPLVSAVHTACLPSDLVISTPAGLFSPATEIARVPVEDEKVYTVKSGTGGTVTVVISVQARVP